MRISTLIRKLENTKELLDMVDEEKIYVQLNVDGKIYPDFTLNLTMVAGRAILDLTPYDEG